MICKCSCSLHYVFYKYVPAFYLWALNHSLQLKWILCVVILEKNISSNDIFITFCASENWETCSQRDARWVVKLCSNLWVIKQCSIPKNSKHCMAFLVLSYLSLSCMEMMHRITPNLITSCIEKISLMMLILMTQISCISHVSLFIMLFSSV
jgi:hypothetical protein